MKMSMVLTFKSGVQVRVDVAEVPTIRRNLMSSVGDLGWLSPDDWTSRLVDFDMKELTCVHVEQWHEPKAPDRS